MAQAAVEFLVAKLITLLENEASLIGGVRGEFNEVKRELESMRSFLKDADNRRDTSNGIKTWVQQVRDAAYDVEDIIDEFIYRLGKHQCETHGFLGSIRKAIRYPKNIRDKRKIASKLQEIRAQLSAISERSKQYGFDRVEVTSMMMNLHHPSLCLHYRSESSLFVDDDDIVGIEKEREILLGWLLEGEQRRTVISVYGMGGSGKTTLVAKIYKSQTVRRHFDCYAWITVSQTYVIEDLFRSMVKEFYESEKELVPDHLEKMSYKQLVETLVDYLQQKTYVVVLDDVWNTSLWKEIHVALPDVGRGCRIMLTTRKEDVAFFSFGVGQHAHHLQPLQQDQAWILFCKKAFSGRPTANGLCCCPPELEVVAHLILDKCEGLPLAIVAMGGLMSTKANTSLEWRRVYDSLNWELCNNPTLESVKSILLLSYNDLPYYLKHCFLYCCVFPEDYIIKRKRLIRLWVAEGFVEERRGMTVEEVADTYVRELVSRSLLQVVKRNDIGRPKECKIHDLMRELALSASEKENFCVVYDDSNDGNKGRHDNTKAPRRLSSHKRGDASTSFNSLNISQLRSFFMFLLEKIDTRYLSPSSSQQSLLPSGFRLLRVLDLQGIPITSIPDELVDLFNLRYLNLRKTQVRKLPNSIGRLQNLQTLDIRDSKVEALPRGVTKLKNLRNVTMYRYVKGSALAYEYVKGNQVPVDMSKLRSLQVLACIEADGDMIKQVGNMTQLRRIGLTKVREAHNTDLCSSIQKLNLLHYLFVMMINEHEPLQLDAVLSPPPRLQTLIMVGKLEKVPLWFPYLNNLNMLYLHWSQLREDLLIHIHALPCLGSLTLINAYEGQQLSFHCGWFLKLKQLRLLNFPELNTMVIEKGALPNLEQLYIKKCIQLKRVPDGIQHLKNLQLLSLSDVRKELIDPLRVKGSEERQNVEHIPEIDHYYRSYKGRCYESLSSTSLTKK